MPTAAVESESRRLVRVTTALEGDLSDDYRDFTHHNRVHQTKVRRAPIRILAESANVAEKALGVAHLCARSEWGAGRGSAEARQ